MLLILCFVLLAILFVLPFVPGAREIRRKDDAAPLFINMSYCKDPRYFAVSFRKIMQNAIGDMPEGLHDVKLSKKESVRIVDDSHNIAGAVQENIIYARHDLESGENVTFKKEVYAIGNAYIGVSNHLKALACDGDVTIRKGTRFLRWLDAEGSAKIEEECHLGISATCRGELSMDRKCSFTRLYGNPIVTGASPIPTGNILEPALADSAGLAANSTERDISGMPAHCLKNCNIIANGSLTIGEHSVIQGHVKSHGKIVTGASVTVMGNLFAEGDIEIGPGSRVLGSVFSQGRIIVRQGVTIGTGNRTKSIIGKKGISIEDGVRIYGYLVTEGEGVVV